MMDYVKWGAAGFAGLLVADMVGNIGPVAGLSDLPRKAVRGLAAGLTVAAVHKFLIKV